MDANSSSWENNFHNTLILLNKDFKFDSLNYAASLEKMELHFWNRFKSSSDLSDFKDEQFFLHLANYSLECLIIKKGRSAQEISDEAFDLGKRKNRDYGSGNLLVFGTIGIIVRIGDKLKRLNTLKNNKAEVDESMTDTLMDIFNYSVYAYMLSKNIWY